MAGSGRASTVRLRVRGSLALRVGAALAVASWVFGQATSLDARLLGSWVYPFSGRRVTATYAHTEDSLSHLLASSFFIKTLQKQVLRKNRSPSPPPSLGRRRFRLKIPPQ